MLASVKTDSLLFLDIETVPQYSSYDEVPVIAKKLWEKKSAMICSPDQTPGDVYNKAGLYCEFGKIICISAGIIHKDEGRRKIRIKSFAGDDERVILIDFVNLLKALSAKREIYLCAHNGKEFDFPYIGRRILVNGIVLPEVLDLSGKKPWDYRFVDTMEIWKFGEYRHSVSLELLAYIFGIPSPKNDIEGSMVEQVYYKLKDLKRIVTYCEKDVITTIQLMLRFKGEPLIDDEDIHIVKQGTA